MKHLSERELLELLYEAESMDSAVRSVSEEHLASCAECRRQFQEFQNTTAALKASKNPQRSPEFDLDSILASTEPEKFSTVGLRPNQAQRLTQRSLLAIAASSILVFVAAAGFAVGAISQANRNLSQFEQRLDEFSLELDDAIAQEVADRIDPADAELAELEKKLAQRLRDAVDRSKRTSSRETAQLLGELEPYLANLVDEQRRIRRDLESLAINAEFVISDSKQEFDRRINELASHMQPPGE